MNLIRRYRILVSVTSRQLHAYRSALLSRCNPRTFQVRLRNILNGITNRWIGPRNPTRWRRRFLQPPTAKNNLRGGSQHPPLSVGLHARRMFGIPFDLNWETGLLILNDSHKKPQVCTRLKHLVLLIFVVRAPILAPRTVVERFRVLWWLVSLRIILNLGNMNIQ